MDFELIVMLRRANDATVAHHISLLRKLISGKKTDAYVIDAFSIPSRSAVSVDGLGVASSDPIMSQEWHSLCGGLLRRPHV